MATKDFGNLSASWTPIDDEVFPVYYAPWGMYAEYSLGSCGNLKLRVSGNTLEYEATFKPLSGYYSGTGETRYRHFLKEFAMSYPGGSVTISNPYSGSSNSSARTVTGSVAISGYGSVTVRPNILWQSGGSDGEQEWDTTNVKYTEYTGRIPKPVPDCNITLNTDFPYAGGNVSLTCTCGSGVTSGTVKRYYKAAGAHDFTDDGTIQSGVTSRTTITDTLPASYGGGQVYYRYEINNGDNYAVTATKNVRANSAPSTPATLTVPSSIAGGSTISVSWSASTDPDGDTVKYVLERSTDGGATWGDNSVYNGPALETTDTIPFGTVRVRYKIHAYDTYGAESGYKYAPETGDYTVTNNRAPSVPDSKPVISAAQVTTGSHPMITWGKSTDPDGDAFDYVLERSASGGTWEEAYRGAAQRFEETIGSDWTSVKYRVKAQDSLGASSDYAVMDAERTVISNAAPSLQLSYNTVAVTDGEDIGVIVDPDDISEYNMSYVVSDTNASDSLTVREIVDGVVRKTITNAVRNQAYSFNFRTGSAASTSYWKKLLDGTHTVVIEVSDGKAVTRRTFTFLKNAGSCLITLKTAIQAAAGKKLGIAAVSICGSIPAGCLTSVEVTADGGEHWESCKIASGGTASGIGGRKVKASGDLNEELLGGHYLFLHKFTNAGNKFNYRILCTAAAGKNGWISSVQGAFTEIGTSETAVFG